MRRTKEEAQVTRDNLLSAALHVFSQNGYAATRLEDIAQAAQVTRGAIYHHFGNKEALYKALVVERSTGINQLAQEILAQGDPPVTTLRRLLVRLFSYVEEDAEYRALLELAIGKVEMTAGLESITRQTVDGRRLLASFLADLVRQGMESGDFRTDLDADDAALALVGYMNGLGLIWIQDQSFFSIKQRAEALVDLFLKGLQA